MVWLIGLSMSMGTWGYGDMGTWGHGEDTSEEAREVKRDYRILPEEGPEESSPGIKWAISRTTDGQ